MIDIWAKLQNRISGKQNWRLLLSLLLSATKGFPALVRYSLSLGFLSLCVLCLRTFFYYYFFSTENVVCLKPNRSKLWSIVLLLEDSEGGNNSVAKPKQRLAFISPPYQVPGAFLCKKKKKKKKEKRKKSPITHTYARMDAHTHIHTHLIRLSYILMPHGQMIIEAQLGCFCAAAESRSHVWGCCVCVCVCVCLCMCVCQRIERGGIDSGERMNLETWRERRANQSQMVR